MPDNAQPEDTLAPGGRVKRGRIGDVPDAIQRRYYTDDRGGPGRGFYVDASVLRPAFRDRGDQLASDRADPNAIRDMTDIARHRGWLIVTARGSAEFRREAWLTGRAIGLGSGSPRVSADRTRFARSWNAGANSASGVSSAASCIRKGGTIDDSARETAHGQFAPIEKTAGAPPRCALSKPWFVRTCKTQKDSSGSWIVARARIADWLERGARIDSPQQGRSSQHERQRSR